MGQGSPKQCEYKPNYSIAGCIKRVKVGLKKERLMPKQDPS